MEQSKQIMQQVLEQPKPLTDVFDLLEFVLNVFYSRGGRSTPSASRPLGFGSSRVTRSRCGWLLGIFTSRSLQMKVESIRTDTRSSK
jgi:hypothetical protein